jgi:hypothetical protein
MGLFKLIESELNEIKTFQMKLEKLQRNIQTRSSEPPPQTPVESSPNRSAEYHSIATPEKNNFIEFKFPSNPELELINSIDLQRLGFRPPSRSGSTVGESPKRPRVVNPVSRKIAERLKREYGSIEEYHRRRREDTMRHFSSGTRVADGGEQNELRECTFRPTITRQRIEDSGKELIVGGLASFLQRQERARLDRVDPVKPGDGVLYSGKVTRAKPFSFLKKIDEKLEN